MEKMYLDDFPGIKYRVNLIREDNDTSNLSPLSNPNAVFEYFKPLRNKDREYFVAVFLKRQKYPIGGPPGEHRRPDPVHCDAPGKF